MTQWSTERSQRGIALITVLWFVALLSLIALTTLTTARREVRDTGRAAQTLQAEALAEGAIHRAIYGLIGRGEDRWYADGRERVLSIADTDIKIWIYDEAGKVDLNAATPEQLAALFRAVNLEPSSAQELADAIGDWRDADDFRRLNGAEASDYRIAGLDYEPRNALFRTVDEVKRVLGMTPALYTCIRPALTLYSGRGGVDPSAATPFVRALFAPADNAFGTEPQGGAVNPQRSASGRAVDIRVEVPVTGGAPVRRHAIVRLSGDSRKPYWTHEWGIWADEQILVESCLR